MNLSRSHRYIPHRRLVHLDLPALATVPPETDPGAVLNPSRNNFAPYLSMDSVMVFYDRFESRRSSASLNPALNSSICFNYLGQIGNTSTDARYFNSRLSLPAFARTGNIRAHLLEINSYILDNRLSIDFAYSRNLHQTQTIHDLSHNFNLSPARSDRTL